MFSNVWGEIIQLAGLIFLVIGVCIEMYYKADFGYVILSLGSQPF